MTSNSKRNSNPVHFNFKQIALKSIGCSLCVLLTLPSLSVASRKHSSRRKHAAHAETTVGTSDGSTKPKHARGRKTKRRGHSDDDFETRSSRGPKAAPEVIELFQKPAPTPEPEDFRRHLAPPTIPQGLTPTR